MKLFILLIAPFFAFIVFAQTMQLMNTFRNRTVRWRGQLRTRDESPSMYWALIGWNVGLMGLITYLYGDMILQEFG